MEEIRIISEPMSKAELAEIARKQFGNFVKAVVDLKREIMAIGGELHADEEAHLLKSGSEQGNLWGINVYPDMPDEELIEFDSMINIRPLEGNVSRFIESADIRERIATVVRKLIK